MPSEGEIDGVLELQRECKREERNQMSTPIVIETSNPAVYPRHWTVRADAELTEHQVAMHIDQGLRAAIFHCSCGSRYSWSIGVEFDPQPCPHILPVCLALLEERRGGFGQ